MALLGQIHIFLNVPNLYWTSHWMKLCCATLGISKWTEYVFPMTRDRFDCIWILFRLFLSLVFHKKFRRYRKSQVLSKKAQTLLLSQRKLIWTQYYTESVFHSPSLCIHSTMCSVNLHCFKIASRGIWCQASTRTESLAFTLVGNFWMDALSITIVHTYTLMFVKKCVFFILFFWSEQLVQRIWL